MKTLIRGYSSRIENRLVSVIKAYPVRESHCLIYLKDTYIEEIDQLIMPSMFTVVSWLPVPLV